MSAGQHPVAELGFGAARISLDTVPVQPMSSKRRRLPQSLAVLTGLLCNPAAVPSLLAVPNLAAIPSLLAVPSLVAGLSLVVQTPTMAAQAQADAEALLEQARQLVGQTGREQEVIRLTTQSLALKSSAPAYFYRGLAKADLGDGQGAIADFDKVLEIDPQVVVAYINRAIAKRKLGDNRGAIIDFDKALAINSKMAISYNGRGVAKRNLGDIKGAIADYSQALAIDPQGVDAYRNRGIAYELLGDLKSACKDWRSSASLGDREAGEWVRQQCDRRG